MFPVYKGTCEIRHLRKVLGEEKSHVGRSTPQSTLRNSQYPKPEEALILKDDAMPDLWSFPEVFMPRLCPSSASTDCMREGARCIGFAG